MYTSGCSLAYVRIGFCTSFATVRSFATCTMCCGSPKISGPSVIRHRQYIATTYPLPTCREVDSTTTRWISRPSRSCSSQRVADHCCHHHNGHSPVEATQAKNLGP